MLGVAFPVRAGRPRRGMRCLPPGALLALMGLLFARTMAWTSSGKTHPELVNNLYSEYGRRRPAAGCRWGRWARPPAGVWWCTAVRCDAVRSEMLELSRPALVPV